MMHNFYMITDTNADTKSIGPKTKDGGMFTEIFFLIKNKPELAIQIECIKMEDKLIIRVMDHKGNFICEREKEI